jgi:hypothetical protein
MDDQTRIHPRRWGTIRHEIGTVTQPIADLRPEEIGLTLAEGHELVRDIERRMIVLPHVILLPHASPRMLPERIAATFGI